MDKCIDCRNYHPTLEAFERYGSAQATAKCPASLLYCRTDEDREAYMRGYTRGKAEREAFDEGYEAGYEEGKKENK